MILLNKKRLFIILSSVTISIITFLFFTSYSNLETIETVALPVSNKVIVIDAGHRNSR